MNIDLCYFDEISNDTVFVTLLWLYCGIFFLNECNVIKWGTNFSRNLQNYNTYPFALLLLPSRVCQCAKAAFARIERRIVESYREMQHFLRYHVVSMYYKTLLNKKEITDICMTSRIELYCNYCELAFKTRSIQ